MLPTLLINPFFPPLSKTTTGPVTGFFQSYKFVFGLRLRSEGPVSARWPPQRVIDGVESSVIDGRESSAAAKLTEDLADKLPWNIVDVVSSVDRGSVALE